MIDYELEYLNWKKRQIVLQQKYQDTPPGLTPEQAKEEEEHLLIEWDDYQERKRFHITTGVHIEDEPFVGRLEKLETIKRLFASGTRTIFLSGIGGIGKSALARTYGKLHAEEYDQILLWSYVKDLEQIFADDEQLGISNMIYSQNKYRSRRRYARDKYDKLKQIANIERILIILDNYNRLDDLWFDSLLEIQCDLIITTRLSAKLLSEAGYVAVSVRSFSCDEDWRNFYRLYAQKEPDGQELEAIENYRKSVQGHTLRMKLALCNTEKEWTKERIARSMFSNYHLIRDEIQILCELSYITLHGIPKDVYLLCTKQSSDSLNKLVNYSLIQQHTDVNGRIFVSLLPVIAESVQSMWRPSVNRCIGFLQEFAYYARQSWYRTRKEDLWFAPQVIALLNQLPKPIACRYYMYECLATFLLEWEYFSEAEQIVLPLYECVRSYYGEKHQFTAFMAMRVATVYYDQMRFDNGRIWFTLSYNMYKEAKPENNSFYAEKTDSCTRLARVYEYEGKYEDAHRCLDEAVEAMECFRKVTEEADPERWRYGRMRLQYTYTRRAWLYLKQGDIETAQRELKIGINMFPLDEFNRLEISRPQVSIYLAKREYEKALETAASDLEVCLRYQGESVKMSMGCRERLGDALRALGKLKAAEDEYIRVLSLLQERYPYRTEWIERLKQKLGETF